MRGVPRIPRAIKGGGGGGELIVVAVLLVAQLVLVLVWLTRLAWFYTGGLYLHRRRVAHLATSRTPLYVEPIYHTQNWSNHHGAQH